MNESQRGVALLIVIWVMTILTVIAFSFSTMTRAESFGTIAFKEGVKKKLLAEAGIERGVMEMIYRSFNREQTMTLEGRELWKPDGTAYTVDMGEGGCVVRVIDESGKISLNSLTDASGIILNNLLIHQGTSPENAAIIVDSILDWKDADDLHRLSGAENDYYKTLSKPYQTGNKDFETSEQLILVRGVTTGILYGTGQTKGIMPYLTAYGKTNRINIYTAPKEILAALPGMDAGALERIMEFRASSMIPTEAVFRELLGAAYSQMASYIGFVSNEQGIFSVDATGYTETPKKGYSILATVVFDSPRQHRYVYYKSPVEIIR